MQELKGEIKIKIYNQLIIRLRGGHVHQKSHEHYTFHFSYPSTLSLLLSLTSIEELYSKFASPLPADSPVLYGLFSLTPIELSPILPASLLSFSASSKAFTLSFHSILSTGSFSLGLCYHPSNSSPFLFKRLYSS